MINKLVLDSSKFFEKIGKAVIFHDFDLDGCCSAAIIARIIKEKFNQFPKIVANYHHFGIFKKIEKEKNFDTLIFCDIPELNEKKIDKIGKKKRVLIIDHHSPLHFKNATYCNPRTLKRNIYIPTTYLAYKIAKFLKIKVPAWIVVCGVLADKGIKECKNVLKELKKENPELINKIKFDEEFLFEKTKIGKVTKFLSNQTFYLFENSNLIAKKLAIEDSYEKILKDKKLKKIDKKVKNEVKSLLKEFKKKRIVCGKFIYFEIKTPIRIKSLIANLLSRKFKNKIIVIGQKFGRNLELSFRGSKQIKIDLNEFCEKASKIVPTFSGGGHEKACGARMKYLKKEKLLEFLKNYRI